MDTFDTCHKINDLIINNNETEARNELIKVLDYHEKEEIEYPEIVIIVPTIALTDETRRRLHQKFSDKYKIITTTDVALGEFNIFIFPQERAINYVGKIDKIDLLVIDEFYKASQIFDKERAPSLVKAIIKLGENSNQKYFLAPNISKVVDNPFTRGMEIVYLDFNTVFLQKHDLLYMQVLIPISAKYQT
jgi:hypothetical protein